MNKKPEPPSRALDRRRFLREAGVGALAAGGTALLGLPNAAAAGDGAAGTDGRYDVIVVGGGFAGVTASRECRKHGYRTLLLEARNRLGGRTFSTDFDGTHVELGGFWIHHTQPFVWAEKERYGLEIVETPGAVAPLMRLEAGGKVSDLKLEQILEAVGGWQQFTEPGREILPRAWDLRFNRDAVLKADAESAIARLEASGLTTLQKQFARGMIATMVHAAPESMSFLELLRWNQCGGGFFPTLTDSIGRFALKDGTSKLIDKMLEDGRPDVRLSTPVKAIEDRGDRVVVTTAQGETLTATAVIVSLPMNTVHEIAFDPPLPQGVVEAGRQRHCGSGIKLYMKVRGDVGNFVGLSASGPLDSVITYEQGADHTVLIGFGGDPAALDVNDDDAVQAALRRFAPGAELLSSISYDWNGDPYSRGTYCNYRRGWVARYYDDFNRDLGRIYFGSSDHGEGWRGFIDGAIGGGIRAAQRVKARLG